jgi:conjugative relaxase-like TrwC/TraI family protein
MRMMGAESVAYHRETVMSRADDHPGAALGYYASRGETPLVWGGSGAGCLGLNGAVTDTGYEAIYGPGGATHPTSCVRLVGTRRPGMELVIGVHKSLAVLGVIGRAEDMHDVMDAERDATLAYLDDVTRRFGGRRGRAGTAVETSGLVFAHTRHGTSRAGDPAPHDHVLVANLVEMRDERGGWKAADTTVWREHLHAATVTGRVASARRAAELGYAIEPDDGPSGRLGQWRIVGVPVEVEEVFSKRAAEVTAAVEERGVESYRARQVAARTTRTAKRFTPVADLMAQWEAELAGIGLTPEVLVRDVDGAGRHVPGSLPELLPALSLDELRGLRDEVFSSDGRLAARKVFARRDVVVAVGPKVFGRDPSELVRAVDVLMWDSGIVPLVGVAGAREQVYAPASVIAVEAAIATTFLNGVEASDAAAVPSSAVEAAIARKEADLGDPLSDGQADAVWGIATSGRRMELVVGVAGAGKTTALACVRDVYESAGHRVIGASTSGQAARTLGREAGIESRTIASLLWRLDHDRESLDAATVVIVDEVGMTNDRDILRVLVAAGAARAKVVLVGDDRQLGPVGPGGAFAGLLNRAHHAVHVLDENVRQHDPGERRALEHLRAGDVERAVDWYARNQRITVASTRDNALNAMVDAWMGDVCSGLKSGLYAWRRDNVADLNTAARAAWAADGRLNGLELEGPGGRRYAAGDRIVTLAPAAGAIVTSERGTVTAVDPDHCQLVARMDDGRDQIFAKEDLTADRLDYGYATTVHRAQGATVDVGHRFHDGGGRELAYVAMGRARQHATVHVVADDIDQAVEDLQRDWAHELRPRWAIDTGIPETNAVRAERSWEVPADLRDNLRHARQSAEHQAGRNLPAPEAAPSPSLVRQRLQRANEELTRIEKASGPFDDPELTAAAQALSDARNRSALAERTTTAPGLNWRGRRRWQREAAASRTAEHDATAAWTALAEPRWQQLTDQIHQLEETIRSLPAQPEPDRITGDDLTLEQLVRSVLDGTGPLAPNRRYVGRSLPYPQRPIDTPDLGLEL